MSPAPRHGFQHIPPLRRAAWEPVLNELGPDWMPFGKKWPRPQTMEAMTREAVAKFVDMGGILFGRLTPAGVALRDAWIRSAMLKFEKARPRINSGGRARHSGK